MRPDVVVIGGGIAGVSAAFFLTEAGMRVVLVEAEQQLAHHSTGRSAAVFFENYGAPPNRPLTFLSKPFLENPPMSDRGFLSERGAMWIAREDQLGHLTDIAAEGRASGSSNSKLAPEEARAIVPVLKREYLAAALLETDAFDIDVAGLHQEFVRGTRRKGGKILTSAPVESLERRGDEWHLVCGAQEITCDVVVNAAGAWADIVAGRGGVDGIGLQPRRRTAFMVAGRPEWKDWPLVVDTDHDFYFKPDGVQLLCSPADETPTAPCDARGEEIDIALAIERINQATDLAIRSVRSSWAGLRNFVSDEALVIGFDPDVPGFFWLAGQGGTGIQTSPAAGRLTAALINETLPKDMIEAGVDVEALSPHRLRRP